MSYYRYLISERSTAIWSHNQFPSSCLLPNWIHGVVTERYRTFLPSHCTLECRNMFFEAMEQATSWNVSRLTLTKTVSPKSAQNTVTTIECLMRHPIDILPLFTADYLLKMHSLPACCFFLWSFYNCSVITQFCSDWNGMKYPSN